MSNLLDQEYFRLLHLVLEKGRTKKNRTGVNTIGMFGAQARFDLSEKFPLLTTKKVFFKGIVHELLWFLSGSTNIKYLVDNDVHIWDEWAYKRYCEAMFKDNINPISIPPMKYFLDNIRDHKSFAKKWGDLGEGTYGGIWRAFPFWDDADRFLKDNNAKFEAVTGYPNIPNIRTRYAESEVYGEVDQISKIIDKLKTNPDDRRLIISSWHPYWVDHCALPPCHCLFQFHTEELTFNERMHVWQRDIAGGLAGLPSGPFYHDKFDEECLIRFEKDKIPTRRLNCQLYQRSCDLFLGVPFNIASYSLLTCMIAQVVNMVPGDFVHTYGELHLYENHLDQVKEQLKREPKELPTLKLNPEIKNLFAFKYEDISVEGYNPHPTIKAEVAV